MKSTEQDTLMSNGTNNFTVYGLVCSLINFGGQVRIEFSFDLKRVFIRFKFYFNKDDR